MPITVSSSFHVQQKQASKVVSKKGILDKELEASFQESAGLFKK